jgi:hypothetical protein
MVWPLEAGTGATPARRAKAASERSRPGCDQETSSWADDRTNAGLVEQRRRELVDEAEDLTLQLVRFEGGGLDAAGKAAQHEPGRDLARVRVGAAKATATLEQPPRRKAAQLIAEPVGRGHHHAAQLHQRLPADVDGAPPGD